MKKLLAAIVVVLLLVLLGWLRFGQNDNGPNVQFDSKKAASDVEKVGEKAKELGEEAVEGVKRVEVDFEEDADDELAIPDVETPAAGSAAESAQP